MNEGRKRGGKEGRPVHRARADPEAVILSNGFRQATNQSPSPPNPTRLFRVGVGWVEGKRGVV